MLGVVGLADRDREPVKRFSGGMKRRLNLACGLLHEPSLLVLDEPTVGVDPQSRNHIFETVRALRDAGMTVVYTTHYMEEVEALCDRVAIMDAGAIVALGTVRELIAQHAGRGLAIELAGGDPAAAEAAAAAHAEVRRDGTTLHATPRAGLAPLLASIEATGASITRIESRQANLEAAFLALTGRALRDDADAQVAHVIAAAIWKDILLLVRDRGTLVSLFALPIVFMVAFGAMFRPSAPDQAPRAIAFWAPPGLAQGSAVADALVETQAFVARPLASAEAVRAAVAAGEVEAGLIVPAEVDPIHCRPVELSIDRATPIQVRAPLVGAMTAVVTRALGPHVGPPTDYIDARSPPGIRPPLADISAFQITVPGNAVLFGFYIALTVAMSFAGERRTGTWRRLLAAPVPRWKVMLATLVPYYVIGLLQLTFLFGLGAALFGMHVAGSVPALALLSMAVVACAVCLGPSVRVGSRHGEAARQHWLGRAARDGPPRRLHVPAADDAGLDEEPRSRGASLVGARRLLRPARSRRHGHRRCRAIARRARRVRDRLRRARPVAISVRALSKLLVRRSMRRWRTAAAVDLVRERFGSRAPVRVGRIAHAQRLDQGETGPVLGKGARGIVGREERVTGALVRLCELGGRTCVRGVGARLSFRECDEHADLAHRGGRIALEERHAELVVVDGGTALQVRVCRSLRGGGGVDGERSPVVRDGARRVSASGGGVAEAATDGGDLRRPRQVIRIDGG